MGIIGTTGTQGLGMGICRELDGLLKGLRMCDAERWGPKPGSEEARRGCLGGGERKRECILCVRCSWGARVERWCARAEVWLLTEAESADEFCSSLTASRIRSLSSSIRFGWYLS